MNMQFCETVLCGSDTVTSFCLFLFSLKYPADVTKKNLQNHLAFAPTVEALLWNDFLFY